MKKITTDYEVSGISFKMLGILRHDGNAKGITLFRRRAYDLGVIFRIHCGYELVLIGNIGSYAIYLHPMLQKLCEMPERAWQHVLCRLWLDRLTFQYEAGYAAGLKEGVKNASSYACAFDGLTPEEYEALGDGFSNDERRDAKELASLEYINGKGAFQPQIDAIKARMKQRADIARWKEERGVLSK